MITEPTPANPEAERFRLALKGLSKAAQSAEDAAAASENEPAEAKAVALRRRLTKAEKLHAEYVRVVNAMADHHALDAAQKAYDAAVSKASAKLETILPGIHRDESAQLVTKYAAPKAERMALLAEQAVAGNLASEKLRLSRGLWEVFEAAGTVASGADSGARGLIEKGRGA